MAAKRKRRTPSRRFSEREIHAIMARAEHMVDCMRNCLVCWGWRISEGEARTFLKNFRMSLGPHYAKPQEAAHRWLADHGQSLAWLLAGDPTGMIIDAVKNFEAAKRSRELTLYSMKKAGFKITEPPKQKEAA